MSEDRMTLTTPKQESTDWRWWLTRLLAGAVGVVLLVAGVLKSTDLEMFIKQIKDYDIISSRTALALTAWGLIVVECVLGVALLIFYRPRITLLAAGALFLVFMGAIGWAWVTGATEDCGCFGAWAKRTPAQAMLEDVLFLAAIVGAWFGHRRVETPPTRLKAWIIGATCIIGLALPMVFGFPLSAISQSKPKTVGMKLDNLQVQGLDQYDLRIGEYLVILLDTECSHCQAAVPKLNALTHDASLPPMVALCKNEEWRRVLFANTYKPAFPLGQIGEKEFLKLLAAGETPRLMLVRDQEVLKIWDKDVPPVGEIKAAMK